MMKLTWFTGCTALLAVAGCSSKPEPPSTAVTLPQSLWQVTPRGWGPVTPGMSIADVASKVDAPIALSTGADSLLCQYAKWQSAPPGIRIMAESARVVRVDVDSGTTPTALGARIGDTEDRIKELYGSSLTVAPNKFTAGHDMIFAPPGDGGYRIIFETDGAKVLRYHAGKRPQVEYTESCG